MARPTEAAAAIYSPLVPGEEPQKTHIESVYRVVILYKVLPAGKLVFGRRNEGRWSVVSRVVVDDEGEKDGAGMDCFSSSELLK